MQSILLVIHLLLSISLIVLILLQHGKGADAGAAFGSGASATVFGSRGSTSFLSRTTAILATLFFTVSLALAILSHRNKDDIPDLTDKYQTPATQIETAAPEVPAASIPESDIPTVPIDSVPVNKDAAVADVPSAPTEQPAAPAAEPETGVPAAPAE